MFSSVNITDSRYMRQMTEAAVRDSAGVCYFSIPASLSVDTRFPF